jgi:1,4-dihydroxy-6-naphthoate synthase
MNEGTRFTLAYSPCPNDTFIFDALVNGKIDTEGLSFELTLDDVESLNSKAFKPVYDITKISFFAYAFVSDVYQLLRSGAALGKGAGPLLISDHPIEDPSSQISSVAIPGKYTTANLLLSLYYPGFSNKKSMLFSEIENAVLRKETDAGVIIHENRFTYEQKGLVKITDLGEMWENDTGLAIPLGAIAIRRSISDDLKVKINSLIRKSIEYAFANPGSSFGYVQENAQEMDPEVIRQHIHLYVNQSSHNLNEADLESVRTLYEKAASVKLIPELTRPLFVQTYAPAAEDKDR